jgi:hypothetical protein
MEVETGVVPRFTRPPHHRTAQLGRGAWKEARARFEAALKGEVTPEALEGLGGAAWWLEDVGTTIDARRRVYRLYRNAGDRRGTARWRNGPRPLARCASLGASGAAGCVAVIGKVTVSVTVYFDNHDNLCVASLNFKGVPPPSR